MRFLFKEIKLILKSYSFIFVICKHMTLNGEALPFVPGLFFTPGLNPHAVLWLRGPGPGKQTGSPGPSFSTCLSSHSSFEYLPGRPHPLTSPPPFVGPWDSVSARSALSLPLCFIWWDPSMGQLAKRSGRLGGACYNSRRREQSQDCVTAQQLSI